MKSRVLAATAAASLASPLAFAQNVTLFGGIDVGYQRATNYSSVGNANRNFIQSGQDYTSRLGVKGSDDLMPGVTALFVLESQIQADVGSEAPGGFWQRQAYGGIENKQWGTLTLGRQYNHIFGAYALGSFNILNATGSLNPAGAAANQGTATNPFPIRASNSVKYSSAKLAGFTFGALWSPGSGAGAGSTTGENTTTAPQNGRYWDANVLWSQGPFGAGFAVGRARADTGTDTADLKRNQLTGKWDTGVFGVYAGYATDKRDAVGTLTKVDDRFLWIQPVFRFGGINEVFGLYGKANDKAVTDNNTTWWGVGARHYMTKRTWSYAAYGKAKNNALATRTPTTFATSATPGNDPAAFQVGVATTF